jgi:ubiquitin carboxyl-terminal hydrolase 5/13
MEAVRELAVTAKTPSHYDKVYKDECSFCFCTAQSPGGLYVNLTTFQAFCAQHVALDQQRSGAALHLHEHARKVGSERPVAAQCTAADQRTALLPGSDVLVRPLSPQVPLTAEEEAAQQAAPDKLAIGMQGGFDVNATKYNIEKDFALVVMPTGDTFQLPCADLPEQVLDSIAAVQVSSAVAIHALWCGVPARSSAAPTRRKRSTAGARQR